jgi:hypothetical protein
MSKNSDLKVPFLTETITKFIAWVHLVSLQWPKVPFLTETITKCFCPQCPVQGNSWCVTDKMEKLPETMKTTGKVPKSQDFPGVYCSAGIAACKDLDTKQMCICGGCTVWKEYNLISGEQIYYFCKNGRAR